MAVAAVEVAVAILVFHINTATNAAEKADSAIARLSAFGDAALPGCVADLIARAVAVDAAGIGR